MPEAALAAPVSTPPATVKFRKRDSFQGYVRTRVDRYFRMTGRVRHGGARMFTKSALILLWLAAAYVALVFFATSWPLVILAAAALGLACATVGFSIQHDAGHQSYAPKKWVNRLMALSLDLTGGSSYIWNVKHNKLHHTYTNIVGHDDDIELGALGRLSPHQPWHWFHRYQHYYLWTLYSLIAVKWQLFDDYRDILRARIGSYPIDRPRGLELAYFIGGKMAFITLAFVIPCLFHPVWVVAVGYLLAMGIAGVVLSTIFQLAHVVEPASHPLPHPETGDMEESWAVHQMQTTVDFAPHNRPLTWLVGGLNFQAEHHLLPHISHIHYPRISKLVERACKRYSVPYHVHPTLLAGIASHFRQLRLLGRPPELA